MSGGEIWEREYKAVSEYPCVMRDISVIMPAGKAAADIAADIESVYREAERESAAEGVELCGVRVFDVYELSAGEEQRSVGCSVSYGSRRRTLKDEEVDAVNDGVREMLREKGYGVR